MSTACTPMAIARAQKHNKALLGPMAGCRCWCPRLRLAVPTSESRWALTALGVAGRCLGAAARPRCCCCGRSHGHGRDRGRCRCRRQRQRRLRPAPACKAHVHMYTSASTPAHSQSTPPRSPSTQPCTPSPGASPNVRPVPDRLLPAARLQDHRSRCCHAACRMGGITRRHGSETHVLSPLKRSSLKPTASGPAKPRRPTPYPCLLLMIHAVTVLAPAPAPTPTSADHPYRRPGNTPWPPRKDAIFSV